MSLTHAPVAAFGIGPMEPYRAGRLDHDPESLMEAAEQRIKRIEVLAADREPPWDGTRPSTVQPVPLGRAAV